MKTKPFLLATAGSTVDGRTIDDAMLQQIASSYDPKTYGARLNIEHIRGVTGESPFRAYGDVVELSIGKTDVNFNGKKETRTALFGVFDVNEDAKKLNEAGQKVYPSIEIEPNFAGKGFAYLMGCALTDSPASIATQRLEFNRSLPGALTLAGETPEALEFPDDPEATGIGLIAAFTAALDRVASKFAPATKTDPAPQADPAQPAALDFTQLRPLFEQLGSSFSKAIADLRNEFRADADALAVKLQKLEATQEKTPAHDYRARTRSDGSAAKYADVFRPSPRPPRTPSPQDLKHMGYNLSDRGRRALDDLYAAIQQRNNAPRGVSRQFSLDPTSEQRLEDLQRENVGFLQRINVPGVRDLTGQVIGLGATNMIASRRSRPNLPRQPRYVGQLQDREYLLKNTLFDTWLPWETIDNWSKFSDFATRYSRQVAVSVALSRIMVGFHGLTAAADTDAEDNPMGEDVNIGWLQKLRLERPDHVMGRNTVTAGGVTTATGTAKPIYIGKDAITADGDYKNIDALAYDLIAGMPAWARASTDHVVIVSQDLVDEKYFPMINRPLADTIDGGRSTSDQVTSDIVMSTKQIGGRPAAIVPFFPEGTMLITPLGQPNATDSSNLSIYYQEGSRRRYIEDRPELMAALVDYNSVNEGYVIEHTDYAVMAENITFGDRP